MISSPYFAVSSLLFFFSLDWMRIDVIGNEPHTSFFEGFQTIFPTASLMFTAAKLKIKWYDKEQTL